MSDEEFKKYVEQLFYNFDGMRRGLTAYKVSSEEEAFRHVIKRVLHAERDRIVDKIIASST